ncbi:MAG: trypsin-like peptidase domain-containing protein [Gammaproteobacteria bacterium]|nr:trypsin-like peptidase domain-containing protein [Gammaproteobacteria bacterium]NNC66782.1 trypsin-like serine protease [Gammaproteobacteria bacterium]
MKIRKLLLFILQAVAVGVLAAVLLLIFLPDYIIDKRPVVEFLQDDSERPINVGSGPVSYAEAVRRASPAVVNIYTTKQVVANPSPLFDNPTFRRFFGDLNRSRERTQTSLGSGVIMSAQGYVLTNYHVIENADEIEVFLADGNTVSANVLGADPETDLAVLTIAVENLPGMVISDSTQLEVGDVVLAIGNPFGFGQTVTQGIISATGRDRLGINTFENFIQTDAAINPGNSGGALINAYGELVGINTAIFSKTGGSQGIGFAIPIGLASDVMSQIIEHGRVIRGWLGLELQNLSPQLAESFGLADRIGVLVAGVVRQSPAYNAGIRPGDIILSFENKDIRDAKTIQNEIASSKPNTEISVSGLRRGKKFELQAKIAQRPVYR